MAGVGHHHYRHQVSDVKASAEGYHYRRGLGDLSNGWYKIALPDSMFAKINSDLSDIRIWGVGEHNDTVPVPYLVDIATGSTNIVSVPFKTINPTHSGAGYFYTFEVPDQKVINQLELHFEETNFDWHINISGSQDLEHWQPVTDDYRILAIKNDLTEYGFTTVYFPDCKYRYYRLQIPADKQPHLLSARILVQLPKPGYYNEYNVHMTNMEVLNKGKTMVVDLTLGNLEPVSYLKIDVSDSVDYERPFVLDYLTDSVKTEKGWVYNYARLTEGVLSSTRPNEYKFGKTVCQRMRLTVENGDNPGLTINRFVVQGYVYSLYARITQPAIYYITYGNTAAALPDYDISKFKNKIPDNTREITPGYEEVLASAPVKQIHPLLESKAWLWGIMACIILVLGVFTFKMMTGVGSNEENQ